jgi:hypothetical protein
MVWNAGGHRAVRGIIRGRIRLLVCGLLVLACPIMALSGQPSTQEMIRLSVASTEADWKAKPHFSYIERDTDVKDGETTSKTYRVWMIDGSPYYRLIAIGGEPLSPAQEAQESEKLRQEIAKRASESPKERDKRLEQYQKNRDRMFALLHEMAEAFDFKLVGEENLDDHDTYVLQASPRLGYRPTSRETQILTGMKGKLWIEKDSHQWVKAEAEVIKPVWMGWFIAKVLPGTDFRLEQAPVAEGLWLPEHFSFRAKARILWMIRKNYSHSETYQDYHLLSTSSKP